MVYGEPRKELRQQFWDKLRFLRSIRKGPWIFLGAFNEALYKDEDTGPKDRDENQMELFRDCLNDCGLVDMGFSGPKFTWTNRQEGGGNVKVRLDIAVANSEFLQISDGSVVENIITTSSDHLAILVTLMKGTNLPKAHLVHQPF
jgi:hypothetical protein